MRFVVPLILLSFTSAASAAPMLSVEDSTDGSGTFTYIVTNTTPDDETSDGVGTITLSFGSNHGVFNATAPTGWVSLISPDSTSFGHPAIALRPGESRTFQLQSTFDAVGQGVLSATGSTTGTYPSLQVIGPAVPEPGTLGLLGLGLGALAVRRRR